MKTRRLRKSRGVTLIAILLMMLALAFLGLGAMNSSVLQEHMAGNTRDKNVAMQAAEAALRDAEADIETNLGTAGFSYGCANGLCLPPSMPASGAQSAPVWTALNWNANSRAYGSATGAPALVGPDNVALAAQPQYVIELLPQLNASAGQGGLSAGTPLLTGQPYRITVRAYGARSSTVVTLQSTYIKQ